MSSEGNGKENHSEDLELTNHTAVATERKVSNSGDVDRLLPSERDTTLSEETAAENGRDLPSERDEIASLELGKVQDGDRAKEQSPDDKVDLESKNGNTSGEHVLKLW